MENISNTNNFSFKFRKFAKSNFSKILNTERLIFFSVTCIIVLTCAIPMEIWAINAPNQIYGNGFIRINIVLNTGISFGTLDKQIGLIYFLQFLEVLVLLGVFIFSRRISSMIFMGFAIMGGIYNMIDRMIPKLLISDKGQGSIKNAVLDYFQFFDKSAIFNFSDIFILVGVIGFAIFIIVWLLIDVYNDNKKKENMKRIDQIEIIFENDDLLVLNKPKGLLMHPTTYQKDNTVFDTIKWKIKTNEFEDKTRAGIVQRLDQFTNGLIVVAKNKNTAEQLIQQIEQKVLIRKYLAIVHNDFKDDKIIIKAPIARSKTGKLKFVVSDDPKAKDAITEVKVLKHLKTASYLECTLRTGRTHQIRVHLSYIHHPIFNDPLYGKNDGFEKYGQFLTSYYLRFIDPKSNNTLEFKIKPDDTFNKLLNILENEN